MYTQFLEATAPKDIETARAASAEEWKGKLSLEQFLDRETQLEAILKADGLLLRTWILLKDDNQVSSCESLRTPIYMKTSSEEGSVGTQNVIASVFTPSQFRGKGYAGELMTSVTSDLRRQGPVTLWSDVGNYYERFDYRFANCQSLISPVQAVKVDREVTRLDQEGALSLVPKHAQQVKETVDRLYSADEKSCFAYLPAKGKYAELFRRATFTAEKLGLNPPTSYGATTSSGWAIWTPSFVDEAMYILAIDGTAEDLVTLYSAALEDAKAYGYKLEVYQDTLPDPQGFAASLDAAGIEYSSVTRKSSLPMYISRASWVCAGKYSWF